MTSKIHGDVPYGTLDLMILKTLQARGPLHGFGLAREIERVADLISLNQGSIYPALLRLQQRGLITANWGTSESNRRAKFYALAAAVSGCMASIFKRSTAQLAAGIAVGSLVALLLDRISQGELLEGNALPLVTIVCTIMLGAGLIATAGPARRALRVEAQELLREE